MPGTVLLTTLVNPGVPPDPDYGLNNMAIPESLSGQDYWYRTEFAAPVAGKRLTLTFNGIKALSLAPHLEREDVVIVKLGTMPSQELAARATLDESGAETRVRVEIEHKGTVPALPIKLTLLDGGGQRILPAYYADNYVSLHPGESREVVVALAAKSVARSTVALRGWNVTSASIAVAGP